MKLTGPKKAWDALKLKFKISEEDEDYDVMDALEDEMGEEDDFTPEMRKELHDMGFTLVSN